MSHYGPEAKSYHVVIEATGLGGAAPADGFIDHMTVAQRVAAGDAQPTTLSETLAKERGNSRYETLVKTLGLLSNMGITNQEATGATATTAATSFEFDVLLERGTDAIANEGLVDDAALKRLVARAIMIGRTDRTDYLDPTESAAVGNNAPAPAPRRGVVIDDVVVGSLTSVLATAEAAITVTEL